jgi:hypothetical protein
MTGAFKGFGGYVVNDGQETIGFILSRGRAGYEGFTREEVSVGTFKTAAQAANAVFDAAAKEAAS